MHRSYLKRLPLFGLLAILLLVGIFGIFGIAFAQGTPGGYVPLEQLPPLGGTPQAETPVGRYIEGFFSLAVGAATVLAVLLIVVGGIQYMASEIISGKEEGMKRMQNAIWGFILILSSVLILQTINPNLLNIDLRLEGISPATPPSAPPGYSYTWVTNVNSSEDRLCLDVRGVRQAPIADRFCSGGSLGKPDSSSFCCMLREPERPAPSGRPESEDFAVEDTAEIENYRTRCTTNSGTWTARCVFPREGTVCEILRYSCFGG
ncbi:MAG: hypothetical protein HY455_00445 [Parcubacteria group bacterium]|nr:hypothetical protein [Parcubacteria group bacterium]